MIEEKSARFAENTDYDEPQRPKPAYFSSTSLPYDSDVFGDTTAERTKLEEQISRAHRRNRWLTPPKWLSIIIRLLGYLFLSCAVYFFLIGHPLWHGAIYSFWYDINDRRLAFEEEGEKA